MVDIGPVPIYVGTPSEPCVIVSTDRPFGVTHTCIHVHPAGSQG